MSRKFWSITFVDRADQTETKNPVYHFAIFIIVNKILITKNCQILVLNHFLLKYQLYRKTARDKNHLFSSHKVLRIFSEFFQNFLISYFLILVKMKKCTKKLIKNSEKILELYEKKINDFCLLQLFYKLDSIWVKNYSTPIFSNF